MDDEAAVREAVDQWFTALNAMLNGDPAPFSELYSHADDVTYMSAEGTYRVGWAATWADWQEQAEKSGGGHVEGADLHIVIGGDLAVAQHYTTGSVTRPDGETAETRVRESSVFRREDGRWRMIAHHADELPFLKAAFAGD